MILEVLENKLDILTAQVFTPNCRYVRRKGKKGYEHALDGNHISKPQPSLLALLPTGI
jgi:hypothetical protein